MHRFASVILVDPRGWVLLQERDEHPVIAPDKWGLVGGHVEDGEGFEDAAYRELEEETGVRMPPGGLTFWRELEAWDATFRIWSAGVDLRDDDIVVGEGRQIVFVDPALVLDLDLADLARRVIPPFLDSDLYRSLVNP
jgi:ADP-ribose pyrophosphatase YjhB (NUDIX family)